MCTIFMIDKFANNIKYLEKYRLELAFFIYIRSQQNNMQYRYILNIPFQWHLNFHVSRVFLTNSKRISPPV